MNILPDLTGLIPKTRCHVCGGAYRTMGPGSVRVPHWDWCPRGPKNVEAGAVEPRTDGSRKEGDAGQARGTAAMPPIAPASTERQDQEREALTELTAPFVTTTLTAGDFYGYAPALRFDYPDWEPPEPTRRTVFPGRSYWEPDFYDIGSGVD